MRRCVARMPQRSRYFKQDDLQDRSVGVLCASNLVLPMTPVSPSDSIATRLLDDLHELVTYVQNEADGSLGTIDGIRKGVYDAHERTSEPIAQSILDAALIVLDVAANREARVQTVIAPSNEILDHEFLSGRLYELLTAVQQATKRNDGQREAVTNSLLEIRMELEGDDLLLLAAALLIVGAARHAS